MSMKLKIIDAYLKGFSNHRRNPFSFSACRFFILEILNDVFVLCKLGK